LEQTMSPLYPYTPLCRPDGKKIASHAGPRKGETCRCRQKPAIRRASRRPVSRSRSSAGWAPRSSFASNEPFDAAHRRRKPVPPRSEEHTSELQSREKLVG